MSDTQQDHATTLDTAKQNSEEIEPSAALSAEAENTPSTQESAKASAEAENTPSTQESAKDEGQPAKEESTASEKNDDEPTRDKSHEGRKEAKQLLKEAARLYKAGKKKIDPEIAKAYENASAKLLESLNSPDGVDLVAMREVKKIATTTLLPFKKSSAREIFESLLFALVFALLLRTFFIEPFKIPTRSMVPTLLEGDQLFVTKLSYGIRLPFLDRYVVRFAEPKRGDVVVFAFPSKDAAEHLMRTHSQCMSPASAAGEKDYIKRIIGVEGDVVEVIEQTVIVNGSPITSTPYYEHTVINKFFIPDRRQGQWNHVHHGDADFTTMTHDMPMKHEGPFTVQPGHIFVMGDNRDNSLDSRCWGQVPVDNIKGLAQIIWWSGGEHGPRWNRIFQTIL